MREETRKICSRESAMCKEKVRETCQEGVIVGKRLSILGEIMEMGEQKSRTRQSPGEGGITV